MTLSHQANNKILSPNETKQTISQAHGGCGGKGLFILVSCGTRVLTRWIWNKPGEISPVDLMLWKKAMRKLFEESLKKSFLPCITT